MDSWDKIFSAAPSFLTVVGMAKNTGKTTTQNYLRKLLQKEGKVIGLLSIGMDGEKLDALTQLPKPAVNVTKGTIVATADSLIERPENWNCLEKTCILTPVGQIMLLQARVECQVILAGPSKNRDVYEVLQRMCCLGAQCILIDGAFDRQSSIDPLISDQVVLSTGASLSHDIHALVDTTKCRVEQLQLAQCSREQGELSRHCRGKIGRYIDGYLLEVDYANAWINCEEWKPILQSCECVIVKGAVVDSLGDALLRSEHAPQVIVQDASRIFFSSGMWKKLRQKKIALHVEKSVKLIGVTVNPICPGGVGVNPDELLTEMGRALHPLPVLDVVRKMKYY